MLVVLSTIFVGRAFAVEGETVAPAEMIFLLEYVGSDYPLAVRAAIW